MRYFIIVAGATFALWGNISIEAATPSPAVPSGLYFIDAHSQFDHKVDAERVISLMDHGGIHRTILSSHRRRSWEDIPAFAKEHPGRIIPAVRIKGKGYHRGRKNDFLERLSGQTNDPAFKAMAEVHIVHQGGERFHTIKIGFDDDLVQAAFGQAKEKGWPFIVHIEFESLGQDERREYIKKLAAFLNANPKHPILLIHMGQLEAGPVRELLAGHKNLHVITSHASPFFQDYSKPFITMFEEHSLKPEWKALMAAYPDRFVFALDNVFSLFWTEKLYLGKMEMWWKAVSELPASVAHAFAHGNAERLWKLKSRNSGMAPPWVAKVKLGPIKGEASERGPGGRSR
jgi:predicted TIM-barrel fold metal-dependent hydrolase